MNTLKNDGNYAKLAINKSLLKEYKTSDCTRTVYMNDGDEFQIQLFNPETIEIGAEIFIDDEPLSNIIILNPGERMWLERYTDKAKKFRFKVYTVDGDSKAVEKAIAHNGEIKIKFYKKKVAETIRVNTDYTWKPWTPIYYDYSITCDNNAASAATSISSVADCSVNYCSCDLSGITGSAMTTGSASASTGSNGKTRSLSKSADTLSFVPSAATFSCGETHYEDGSSCSWASINGDADPNLIETGRVAEGSNSSQRFQTVNIDLEYWPFRTELFKIYPYSRKPFTATDAKKLYCPNCGRKLNTKFKFCPYCGEKID